MPLPPRSAKPSKRPRASRRPCAGEPRLGLRWDDIDLNKTTDVLAAWRAWQQTEQQAVGIAPTGWVSPTSHAIRSTDTRYARPSNGSPIGLESPRSDSTRSATPTPPFGSTPAYPSKWSANDSETGTQPSQSTPTNTCSPACKPKPPTYSETSTHPRCRAPPLAADRREPPLTPWRE